MVYPRLSIASEKAAFRISYKSFLVTRAQYKMKPRRMNFIYRTFSLGISVLKNNFIYEVTENVMSKLIPAGIPQYFRNFVEDVILRPPKVEQEETFTEFRVEDLKSSFVIYLICCAVTILVFIFEILIHNFVNCIGVAGMLEILKKIK